MRASTLIANAARSEHAPRSLAGPGCCGCPQTPPSLCQVLLSSGTPRWPRLPGRDLQPEKLCCHQQQGISSMQEVSCGHNRPPFKQRGRMLGSECGAVRSRQYGQLHRSASNRANGITSHPPSFSLSQACQISFRRYSSSKKPPECAVGVLASSAILWPHGFPDNDALQYDVTHHLPRNRSKRLRNNSGEYAVSAIRLSWEATRCADSASRPVWHAHRIVSQSYGEPSRTDKRLEASRHTAPRSLLH